jgi:peptide/nickel transport system ATP-binding protein
VPPLLDVRGLEVHAGRHRLVGPVDLRIERGERVGIVGPSGSGKSQTALALLGLSPDGVTATSASAPACTTLVGGTSGALFQQSALALDPLMRVGRQVGLPLGRTMPRAQRHRRVRELLSRLELPPHVIDARPAQLSGGQRQRVALALALIRTPDLVVADEPTSALDLLTQAAVLDTFRRVLVEDSASLLMISHDLALVSRLCTRILVLDRGVICEEGPPGDLITSPTHPVTAELARAARLLGVAG